MKYVVCDEGRNGWGDIFTKEFDDREKAVEEGKDQWGRLTASEKAKRNVYVIESSNPDEEAADHLDGDYVWRCDDKQ